MSQHIQLKTIYREVVIILRHKPWRRLFQESSVCGRRTAQFFGVIASAFSKSSVRGTPF